MAGVTHVAAMTVANLFTAACPHRGGRPLLSCVTGVHARSFQPGGDGGRVTDASLSGRSDRRDRIARNGESLFGTGNQAKVRLTQDGDRLAREIESWR
ncbi:hypothetical protein GCM10027569_22320 [Flindersiella endophytica]